ncbi:hypothetical protein IQ260_06855 [Leptolyngbya cf. ectocarpi LEGE 11479]|uniref:Uncharacterized protein n=1 Tax=Leptolyngbya cf. ectocarpi LEGE 11479 TaxID=1828722 RepID=A0A928X4F1_LEPEC|nr:hypothetical protein [Leptolyngbya ectocarpi]MBE9066368.1 hypothetical protein [Leptolyngbya cf. ectocarpi LEGE 11479]
MEIQNLRLAKYLTAGTSFLLLVLGGGLWPFTWWDMYASGDYAAPTQVSRLELHVVDSAGQQHILRPMDLYTLDDDSSPQKPGHQLVQNAVDETNPDQAGHRSHLTRQIEFVLDSKVERIEIWHKLWDVDFDQHPPIAIDQPAQTHLIDDFAAHPLD